MGLVTRIGRAIYVIDCAIVTFNGSRKRIPDINNMRRESHRSLPIIIFLSVRGFLSEV